MLAYGDKLAAGIAVSESRYGEASDGTALPLRYLRESPEEVEFPIGSSGERARLNGIVALLVLGLFLLAVAGRVLCVLRLLRVRAQGELSMARVSRVKEASGWSVGRTAPELEQLVWVFEDGLAGKGEGRAKGMFDEEWIRIGQMIEVYRLGRKSVWVGDVGRRAEHIGQRAGTSLGEG